MPMLNLLLLFYLPIDSNTGFVIWTMSLLILSFVINCLYLNETIAHTILVLCVIPYLTVFYLPGDCCGRPIPNRPVGTVGQALFLFQHYLPVCHPLVLLIPCGIAVAA